MFDKLLVCISIIVRLTNYNNVVRDCRINLKKSKAVHSLYVPKIY